MTKRLVSAPEGIAKKTIKQTEDDLRVRNKKISNADRERYKKRKHLVKTLEDVNYSKIIAFATTGETGFWKLIGKSAIYYVYHEAPRLKKDVSLKRDTDFFDRDENGFVAIPNIEALRESLEKLGGKETAEIDDEYIRVFDMGVKFTEADLKNMMRRETMMLKQINEVLLPKVSDPELYKTLRQMMTVVCSCQRVTEEPLRKLTYNAVVEPARLVMLHYVWMCRNNPDIGVIKKKMTKDLEIMMAGLKMIQNCGLWKLKQLHEISGLVVKAEMLVKKLGNKGNGNGVDE